MNDCEVIGDLTFIFFQRLSKVICLSPGESTVLLAWVNARFGLLGLTREKRLLLIPTKDFGVLGLGSDLIAAQFSPESSDATLLALLVLEV